MNAVILGRPIVSRKSNAGIVLNSILGFKVQGVSNLLNSRFSLFTNIVLFFIES